jgi:hypothetical protein
MKTLLVMTTGQTDVQLVVNGHRHKLDGNTCGELHDQIKARSWSVVDAPSHRRRDNVRSFRIDENGEANSPPFLGIEGRPSITRLVEAKTSNPESAPRLRSCRDVVVLPDGELALCTPKLDAVLETMGANAPTSVLLLETKRDFKSDPRFAGEVMERRLRDRGIVNVTRVAFLTGDERLEDPSNESDVVVRRTVVARLVNAIDTATRNLTRDDRVFVATTGGLAAANELVVELTRLYCVGGATVTAFEVPDSVQAELADQAVEERFHPASGYRARWHALSLIEKGNLLGAWGAVSHLECVPGQDWTQVIKWLAQFAASLPFDPPLPDEGALSVLKHPRMAVRAALRVELALRAGDIPRAVHGTVAFFEAALWDRLLERVERSPDPQKRRHFRFKQGPEPTGDKLLRKGDCSDEDRKRPFELKATVDGINWYIIHDGDGGPAARLANHFFKSDALTKFDRALGSGIRELRNDMAHNEPTPELMNEARTRIQKAKLWSPGDGFLCQDLVQDVLKELGIDRPADLLTRLLCEVRARLRAPESAS